MTPSPVSVLGLGHTTVSDSRKDAPSPVVEQVSVSLDPHRHGLRITEVTSTAVRVLRSLLWVSVLGLYPRIAPDVCPLSQVAVVHPTLLMWVTFWCW